MCTTVSNLLQPWEEPIGMETVVIGDLELKIG